jgi:hypothetical protein
MGKDKTVTATKTKPKTKTPKKIVSASSSDRGSDGNVSDDDISLTSSAILDLSELNLVLSHYMMNSKKDNVAEVLTSIDTSLKGILKVVSKNS